MLHSGLLRKPFHLLLLLLLLLGQLIAELFEHVVGTHSRAALNVYAGSAAEDLLRKKSHVLALWVG